MVSQKGMKHELAEVRERGGEKKNTIKMKPALEAGQRGSCNVEESMVRDLKYRTEKGQKRA